MNIEDWILQARIHMDERGQFAPGTDCDRCPEMRRVVALAAECDRLKAALEKAEGVLRDTRPMVASHTMLHIGVGTIPMYPQLLERIDAALSPATPTDNKES